MYQYYFLEMLDIDKMIEMLGLSEEDKKSRGEYGPGNPEPGGDGSNGEETPEIMNTLRQFRKIVELRKTVPEAFEQGDLVYDERNQEHGVVLGELPDFDLMPQQTSKVLSTKSRTRRYIVLTITTDQESGKKKARIRYANSHNLRLVPEERNSMTDLDTFCSKQCIQECSSVCALYKYKRVADDNEE